MGCRSELDVMKNRNKVQFTVEKWLCDTSSLSTCLMSGDCQQAALQQRHVDAGGVRRHTASLSPRWDRRSCWCDSPGVWIDRPLSVSSDVLCCVRSLSLSRVYEEHVLATGSLDERIFTGEGASEDIGTPGPCLCEGLENQDSATDRLHASLTVRL